MSKIAIKSSSSGTATFTIESPATNTDRTLNLPDSAGTVATAESTLAQFNVTGSAPVFACRAFVNFDGTASTPTIRASGNISSVTRVATGIYHANFAIGMPDANYTCGGFASSGTNQNGFYQAHPWVRDASSVWIWTGWQGTATNREFVGVQVFR